MDFILSILGKALAVILLIGFVGFVIYGLKEIVFKR